MQYKLKYHDDTILPYDYHFYKYKCKDFVDDELINNED